MSESPSSSIPQNFKAGDKLSGCYLLKELVPSQGFCTVWLAHDEELSKDIALHFVPDSVAADARAMTELKQETKRNRQLIHPRIVRVHDFVEGEKWAAISMDHFSGDTLAALQKKKDKGAFNPSELSAGITELCQTLEDAHRIDLFHRDLTPENLISTANGLMVQKFGISRVILDSLSRGGQAPEATRDVAYISPQQLDGERPGRPDDIYSLGATLFDLLTGAPPFTGDDIVPQVRKNVPPLVSERRAAQGITGEPTPKAWDETIAACLGKTPDERPKTAAEAGTRFAAGRAAGAAGPSPMAATEAAVASAAVAAAAAEAVKPKDDSKQQKRPWSPGPGKTPVIAEATVLSKTDVPKSEPKAESKPAPAKSEPAKETPKETAKETSKAAETAGAAAANGGAKKPGPGGPTSPTGFPLRAFVEVEGEPKPKGKSPIGLVLTGIALVVLVAFLVIRNSGSSSNNSEGNGAPVANNAEGSPTPAEGEATPAESASPAETPANAVAANNTPAPEMTPAATPESTPAEAATTPEATSAPVAVAESPAPSPVGSATPIPGLATMTDAQVQQLVADKTKALDQAKAAAASAELAAKEKTDEQAKASAAVQDLQSQIKQKADAAAAAKKAADDSAASLKQQQDALQKAEADAAEAQKAAAAKAQAADQMRKTVQDAQTAAQQQQAAQQQAEADAAQLSKSAADRQKAIQDSAKAAAAAEKSRQQQAQAVANAQADLANLQANLQQAQQARNQERIRKAAEQAAALQKQRAVETARLAVQAQAAAKAAADAQKALVAAQAAVAAAEKAQHDAEVQAQAAAKGALEMPSPAPAETPAAPQATPAQPSGPNGASAIPAPSVAAPTLSVRGPNPHLKVDQALSNSLGMHFAPVGNVFFSVWLTRVQDFETFASATGFKGSEWRNPGFKQAPDHPVVNVSWNDANQFCLWLTQKEHHDGILAANQEYRLPSDLEWSNAVGLPAESGRTPEVRDMDVPDVYPWGTQWPPPAGAGNYTGEETDSDVAIKGYNDGFAWTSPVGSFNANKFGLYDMGGNVWEWCSDWWSADQKAKVLRGGSWYNGALKLSLLSSCRIHASADQGTDNYGFRVVIAQEETKGKGAKHHGQ